MNKTVLGASLVALALAAPAAFWGPPYLSGTHTGQNLAEKQGTDGMMQPLSTSP